LRVVDHDQANIAVKPLQVHRLCPGQCAAEPPKVIDKRRNGSAAEDRRLRQSVYERTSSLRLIVCLVERLHERSGVGASLDRLLEPAKMGLSGPKPAASLLPHPVLRRVAAGTGKQSCRLFRCSSPNSLSSQSFTGAISTRSGRYTFLGCSDRTGEPGAMLRAAQR
jgi:hypothetical protein